MKGVASCIRHEEDKKNRDFEYDSFTLKFMLFQQRLGNRGDNIDQ
jgi:hypothetical protein